VAFDKTQGRVLPFQTLSTRKRKAAGAEDVSVQVAVFAFDLILLNGESLMALPFVKRREILHATFREREAQFYFARFKDTTDQQELAAFLKEAMASGCEGALEVSPRVTAPRTHTWTSAGLMVKALEEGAAYLPDKREWFKIKKDYVEVGGVRCPP
jgi:DNA ligase-1